MPRSLSAPLTRRRAIGRDLMYAIAILGWSPDLDAQTFPDTVAEAVRLRNQRDFTSASTLLLRFVEHHPDDGIAVRLLAQTLYWQGAPDRARTWYEAALARHPADTTAMLEFATMLVETNDAARARSVLAPLTNVPSLRGRPEALLGTLAFWRGDLGKARALLTTAWRADSSQVEVRRHLADIATLLAPTYRIASLREADDQPLTRLRGEIGGTWHLSPRTTMAVLARGAHFASGDSLARNVLQLEADLRNRAGVHGIETAFGVGGISRGAGTGVDWTGRAALGVRIANYGVLRATAERAPYLYTVASVGERVMTRTLAGTYAWQAPSGWLAEARAQLEKYPDGNTVGTAFAWLLAPLVHRQSLTLQVGYGFAAQDSRDDRFVINRPVQSVPVDDPAFDLSGHYAPYHTPQERLAHSLLAGVTLEPSGRTSVRVNASIGVSAHDEAPGFVVIPANASAPATLGLQYVRRAFTPYAVRGELGLGNASGTHLAIIAAVDHSVFYRVITIGMRLDFTRAPPAPAAGR